MMFTCAPDHPQFLLHVSSNTRVNTVNPGVYLGVKRCCRNDTPPATPFVDCAWRANRL